MHLYHKNTKNIILSYLSDLTLVSDREGIDNPFIVLVARFLFVCVGAWDLSMISYWIDTLVLKTKGNTYATLLHHAFLFKGKPTQCSIGSKERPRQYMIVADVQEILKIKVSRKARDDFLAWNPEKDGRFSVRRAYHIAVNQI